MKNQFFIQHPCHQNWDKMNPTEKGKFCKCCKKEVLNFDSFDADLLAKKLKQNAESVCIKTTIESPIQSNIALKRFKYFVLFILFFLWFGSKKVLAQWHIDENGAFLKQTPDSIKEVHILLTGKTIEKNNSFMWVPYVQMNIKKNDQVIGKIVSNKYGNFIFNQNVYLQPNEKLSIETVDSNFYKQESLIEFLPIDSISDSIKTYSSFVLIELSDKPNIYPIQKLPQRAMGCVSIITPKQIKPTYIQIIETETKASNNNPSNNLIVPMPRQ